MKNSQYVNSMNINISEIARITFMEVMPQHNNETSHIITVSMHVDFLKHIYDVIGKSLSDHMEALANISKDKSLS